MNKAGAFGACAKARAVPSSSRAGTGSRTGAACSGDSVGGGASQRLEFLSSDIEPKCDSHPPLPEDTSLEKKKNPCGGGANNNQAVT